MSADQTKKNTTAGQDQVATESPVPESLMRNHSYQFWQEARVVVSLFTVLCVGVLLLWYFWDEEYLSNDEDLVYNLGLIGGIMLLLQFIYAMRKRIPKMRRAGNLKLWFTIHMVIGICGPLIIIIHSRFDISSINGGVALFSMLLVVFSGMAGRYLYSKISFDFAGGRADLKVLHEQLQKKVLAPNPAVAQHVSHELKTFMVSAFVIPKGYADALWQVVSIGPRARLLYGQLCTMNAQAAAQGAGGHGIPTFGHSFLEPEKRILKAYVIAIARLARYNAFKQLFGLWRIAHVPVIYFLLVAGLAHVLAVHMY